MSRIIGIIAVLAVTGAAAAPAHAVTDTNGKPLGPCSIRATLRGDDYRTFRAEGTVWYCNGRSRNVEVRLKLNGVVLDFATANLYPSFEGWIKTQWWYSNASCGNWQAVTTATVAGIGRDYVTSGPPRYFCRG